MAVGGAQWSEAVAVGSLAFVEKIDAIVGIKAVAHKLCRACYYIIKDQLVFDLTKAFALKRRVGPLNAPLQIIYFWSSLLLKESPEELQNWFLESGLFLLSGKPFTSDRPFIRKLDPINQVIPDTGHMLSQE
jgi:hypothetical protein